MRTRLIAALAVFVLLIGAGCSAGQPQGAGPTEGIQVHGDWTIDIYDPDGSLVDQRTFSNALETGGAHYLARLLLGEATMSGLWTIRLGEGVCPSAFGGQCSIDFIEAEPMPNAADPALLIGVRLAGTVAAEVDGTISTVLTNAGVCGGNQAPDDCPIAEASLDVTRTALSSPIDIAAGQVASVEVEITFTSG